MVEKTWTTKAGLKASVILQEHWEGGYSHRCGYVEIPADHPLSGLDYMDERVLGISVHGGVTYADHRYWRIKGRRKTNGNEWWFGFDCAHAGDKSHGLNTGTWRTLKYVMDECESLASQIMAMIA